MKTEIILLLLLLTIGNACHQSGNKKETTDGIRFQTEPKEVVQTNKACLDIVMDIMESSSIYQQKVSDERVLAIEKNGGALGVEVEGSPNVEDTPLSASDTYDLKVYENYEDHTTVIERFTFDPEKKQLYLYNVIEDQLESIDFNKDLLLEFAKACIKEIPIIAAVGGDGTAIDWDEMANNTDPDGPEFFEGDCKEGVTPMKASSTLAPEGKRNYDSKNVGDFDPRTAWVEGNANYGIGEYFEIESPNVNTIYNGYQASPTAWKNNSRVKRFKVYRDQKLVCLLDLTDEMGAQRFELPRAENEVPSARHTFRFVIEDVYKGLKYADVAVSELEWAQCCFSANTLILNDGIQKAIVTTEIGQIISGIDIPSGNIIPSEVVKVVQQKHLKLIRISNGTNQIEVTPNHPLLFKGYGFMSLERYLHEAGCKNYEDIVNTAEVLTFNTETNKLEYKSIDRIEVLHGVFETYSILNLSKGDSYVANGFVTRTY